MVINIAKHTNTQVCIDARVTTSTRQVLVLAVRKMEIRLSVTVLLGQTKVNDIDLVTTLADAHQEVVRLDITMDEGFGVDILNTRDQLICQEQYRLQGEFSVAKVEEIFQAGTKKVKDHGVVVTLGAEPTDEGDAHTAGKGLVNAGFRLELRVLGLDALKLDSNFFSGYDIGP